MIHPWARKMAYSLRVLVALAEDCFLQFPTPTWWLYTEHLMPSSEHHGQEAHVFHRLMCKKNTHAHKINK